MLKRLIPSLRKHFARLAWPDGRGVVRRDGILYLLNLQSGNWYDKAVLQGSVGEPAQREFFVAEIKRRRCDVFLDIGANFGTYSATVAVKTDCPTIIAFEPDERSVARLRVHLFVNGISERVQIRVVAVSDRNGQVPFARAPANNDFVSRVGEDGSAFFVPAIRLDDELALTGQRIAIKLDVEGHELAALDGMATLLRANDCFLQIEAWPQNAAQVVTRMKAGGYGLIRRIDDDHYFSRDAP